MLAILTRKLWTIHITSLLVILLPAVALCERLPIKAYTVAEGLAHNEISKIVRDSRGFLWFCTNEGLSRFDGYEFTNFGTDHGLPHRAVNDFLETKDGELWVATNGGLVRFDPEGSIAVSDAAVIRPMFSVIVPQNVDRVGKVITVLLEGSDGTIWCGSAKGLYRLDPKRTHPGLERVDISVFPKQTPDFWVNDLVEDRHHSLWIASDIGLSRRWSNGTSATYTLHHGFPDNIIHDVLQDSQGRLWVGTRNQGFLLVSIDESAAPPVIKESYNEKNGLLTNWVAHLFETSDHRFWAATNRGIAEFFPGERKLKTYTQRNGLLYYGIDTLQEDSAGNLWLGSDAGAMKLARDGFVSYGEEDGVLSVFSVFVDRQGRPCFRAAVFGDEHRTVFEGAKSDLSHSLQHYYAHYGRFDGQSFTWLKPDTLKNIQMGWVGEMVTLQGSNGEWWLGTGAGVYRYPATDNFAQLQRAKPLAVYTLKDGLTSAQIFRLFEDSRGSVWISAIGPNGLARWNRDSDRLHDLTKTPGLPAAGDNLAQSFGEDTNGNVWIGFNNGVARFRGEQVTFFDTNSGLPQGAIQNIHADKKGRLWFASSSSGLIRIDDPNGEHPVFQAFTTKEGLSSNIAEGITEDDEGRIYVGTGRGLDRLNPATGHIKHFTTTDGLAPGRVISGGRAIDGTLWIGTDKGLSHIVPNTNAVPEPPPPILITELHQGGERQRTSVRGETSLLLPDVTADRDQLQINFVGLSFAPGEVPRYQYKLESADRDWSALTDKRFVNYARLAPGRYRFSVRAINSEGAVSVQPATVTFTILPPIWQRWWFVALTILALGLIVYLLYRYRISRIIELANVRTRIASDLHDDIGSNLTKISILSEVARQQHGNGNGGHDSPLASIARISRESVASMSDIVWAINPQRDSLRDVIRRMRLHAEETCYPHEIDLEFNAPADPEVKLGIETRRSLYLTFKEALNNAVRHSGCWRIRVVLSLEREWLLLEISDNGLGFDEAAESDGNGLLNMRRRAEALGGKLEIVSAAGTGTTVRLRVRHSQLFRFSPFQR